MFRWYKKSEVCYVYLADVHPETELKPFESLWWTRGWTLQELIAPSLVVFYDRNWEFLGTKETLSEEISDRTRVDEAIISGKAALSDRGIAQRMSWAADRVTTRTEDMAYCLMGIFNVHMPLLYGEGKQAFIRLQEEIIRRSDDTSIFAWPIHRENQPGLLADSPSAFAGCQNVIPLPTRRGRFPHSMTNRGLSIRFMAVQFSLDIYLVRLECVDHQAVKQKETSLNDSGGQFHMGIFLRQLVEDDQFARIQHNGESVLLYHASTWSEQTPKRGFKTARLMDIKMVQELNERHLDLSPYAPRLHGFRFSDLTLFNSVTKDGDARAIVAPSTAWDPGTGTMKLLPGAPPILNLKNWKYTIKMLKFGFDWEYNPIVFVATTGGLTDHRNEGEKNSLSIYDRNPFDDREYSIFLNRPFGDVALQCKYHPGLWAIRGDRIDGIAVVLQEMHTDLGTLEVKREISPSNGLMEWVIYLQGLKKPESVWRRK